MTEHEAGDFRQDLPLWTGQPQTDAESRGRFRGCLLGGAVGDALGGPVEFLAAHEIRARFGPEGVTDFLPAYGGRGRITDDTQMTLFTADGLLRAWVRGASRGIVSVPAIVAASYQRWLATQGRRPPAHLGMAFHDDPRQPGWLVSLGALHAARAPGLTCLQALERMPRFGDPARNDSKGCGGVMRVAPVGLHAWRRNGHQDARQTFDDGCVLAGLTHGHPTGQLTAGVLAVLVQALADGAPLEEALDAATGILRQHPRHQETLAALEAARELAAAPDVAGPEAVSRLGRGWVAEEALAIAVYCALVARDFRHGVLLAVNHDGDSDSTAAICGNLLGAAQGEEAIPPEWRTGVELAAEIREIADDLLGFPRWDVGEWARNPAESDRIWRKYPGF